jgi:hypothetical protein
MPGDRYEPTSTSPVACSCSGFCLRSTPRAARRARVPLLDGLRQDCGSGGCRAGVRAAHGCHRGTGTTRPADRRFCCLGVGRRSFSGAVRLRSSGRQRRLRPGRVPCDLAHRCLPAPGVPSAESLCIRAVGDIRCWPRAGCNGRRRADAERRGATASARQDRRRCGVRRARRHATATVELRAPCQTVLTLRRSSRSLGPGVP